VYLFTRNQGGPNQWGVAKRITQPSSDDFGSSVALSGDTALIGGRLASQKGLVVFYSRNWTGTDAWGGISGICDDDGTFGGAVAVSGTTAVIGENQEGSGAGRAFIFRVNP
jgi:hypothetical protein